MSNRLSDEQRQQLNDLALTLATNGNAVGRLRRGSGIFVPVPFTMFIVVGVLVAVIFAMNWRGQVVAQAVTNQKTAQELAAQAQSVTRQTQELAQKQQQWLADCQAWREHVESEQLAIQRITDQQMEMVQASIDGGELYSATVLLLSVGEMIQVQKPSGPELVDHFVSAVHAAIDAAKKPQPVKE